MPRGNEGSDSNVVLWPSFDIGGKGYLTAAEYTKYIDAGGYTVSTIPTTSDAAGGTKSFVSEAEAEAEAAIQEEEAAPSEADPIAQAEETERQRLADVAEETERQRLADVAEETERQRLADVAEETERQRLADVAAETERQRLADVAAETERQRLADVAAEVQRLADAAEAEEAAPSEAVATNWYGEDSIAWWDVNDPAAYFGAVPNKRTAEQTERANRFYDEWAGEGATNSRTAYGTLKGLVDGYYTPSQVDQYWGSSTAISEMSQVDAYSDTIGEYGGDGDEGGGFGDYLQQEWDNFNTSQGVDLGGLNTSPTSGTIVSDGPGGQAEIATAERLAMEAYQNAILAAAQESDIPVSVDSPDGAVYTLNYGQYDDVSLGEYKQTKEPDGFSVNDFVEMGVKMILSSVITGGISGLIKGLAAGTGAVAGAVDGVTGAIANLGSMAKNLVDLPDTIISFVTNPQEFLSNEILRNLPDDGGIIFNLEEGSNAFQYYDALGETYKTVEHVLDTKDAIAAIGQIVALNDYVEGAKGVDGVVPESVINNPATLMQVLNEGADSGLEVLEAQEETAKTFAAAGYDANPEEIINNTGKNTDEIKTYVTQTDPFGDYVFYPSGAGPEEIAEVDARDAEISPMRKIAREILDQIEGIKLNADPNSPEDQAGLSGLGKTLNWVQGVFDDYSDLYQNANAAALKAAGGILEGTAAVSVFWGENPLSTTKGALGRAMAGLGNDSYTPEFKLALKDIAQRTGKAVGIEGKAEAWYGAIKDHPLPFLVDTIGVEVGQEVVPFLIGGLASSGVKGAALFRGVSEELATSMGAKAGFKAGVVADLMESGLMSMGGAYEEALDSLLLPTTINPDTGNPYTQAEAEKAAQTIAITQGAVAIGTTAISMGLGGNALEAKVFKDKAPTGDELLKLTDDLVDIINPSASGAFRTYIKEVSTRLLAVVKDVSEWVGAGAVEAVSEGSEELFQAAALENSLYTYGDKTRDYEGNLFENTLIGTIAGGGTSSVMAGSSFVSDALFNLNPEVNEVVNKGLAEIEAGADPSTVAKNIRESLNTFGIEDKSIQTDFANAVDNEGYTTREEAGAKFAEAGYEFTEEELAQYTGELNEANTLNNIETYVDPRQVTIDEAKAELITQGITDPSDAEIAAYVGQGNGSFQSTQYGQIGTYADPRVVTEAEAKAELIAQGVANPTQAQIDAYKGEGDENFQSTQYGEIKTLGEATVAAAELEAAKEATKSTLIGLGYTPSQTEIDSLVGKTDAEIAAYVDPRVVTEAEAKAQLVAQGITNPTQDQINSFKGEGDENFQSIKNTEIQAYADPRVVTEAEAKAELIAQGISNPTQNEIDAYKGEGDENFQSIKNTEIQAYADPRVVTEAEAKAELIAQGVSAEQAAEVAKNYSGEGSENHQITQFTNINDDTVTEAELQGIAAEQGYSLTPDDIAKYTGYKNQATTLTTADTEFNAGAVTLAELEGTALAQNYSLTPDDIAKYTGNMDQATTLTTADTEFNAGAVTLAELEGAALAQGYSLTPDDIAKYTGNMDQATTLTTADAEFNAGAVTLAELEGMAAIEGYSLTPDDIAEYVGNSDAGVTLTTAQNAFNAGAVTEAELQFIANSEGYTLTPEDIEEYTGNQDQKTTLETAQGVFDDRFVTEQEVIDRFQAAGYTPTEDDDLSQYTGLAPEGLTETDVFNNIDAEAPVKIETFEADQLATAKNSVLDAFIKVGLTAADIATLSDTYIESLATRLTSGDTLADIQPVIDSKAAEIAVPGTAVDRIMRLIDTYETNGLTRDAAIKQALGNPAGTDAAGNPTPATGVYAILGGLATGTQVAAIESVVGKIAEDLGTNATEVDQIKQSVGQRAGTDADGNPTPATGIYAELADLATKADVKAVETNLTNKIIELLGTGTNPDGTPITVAQAIKQAVGEEKGPNGEPTGLFADIAALPTAIDTANLQTAIDNVKTEMLTNADIADLVTEDELDSALKDAIGNAEDGTGIFKFVATKTDLANLRTDVVSDIKALLFGEDAVEGLTLDEAIKAVVGVPKDADGNPTGLYEDLAGIDVTVDDIKTIVTDIQTNMLTDADLADLVTKAQLDTAFSTNIGNAEDGTGIYKYVATKTEVAAVETNVIAKIKELLGTGELTVDEAIKEAVGVPKDPVTGEPTGLYKDLAGLDVDVDAVKTIVDNIQTNMLTDDDLADLVTKDQLETAFTENIGNAEDGTGIYKTLATKTEVAAVETNVIAKIKELLGTGELTVDEAIKEAVGVPKDADGNPTGLYKDLAGLDVDVDAVKTIVDNIATTLGTTASEVTAIKTALENNLGAPSVVDAEGNITTEATGVYEIIEDLATKTQVSDVETTILAKIKEYEDAGLTRDEALQAAIDQVATDLGTTKEAITQQLTNFQTKLDADLSLLATKEQVNEFETELYLKIAEYEALGVERDIATQAAIQELATEMGTNQTALMEQMGLTETNLTTRINDVETNLTNQFDTTQQLITDTATKTQQQIDTTATETQKQVKTAANQSAARDFFDMVLGSEDLEGQQVTVSQSPLAQINYIYDFQDPLANQQQRGFFGAASPYGESLAAGKSRRPQTIANVMQGPLNLQGAPVGPMGMAAGGKVDYDFLNEISQIMSFGE